MMVVLQEVAAALAYMHSNEITHNDMKRPGGIQGYMKRRYGTDTPFQLQGQIFIGLKACQFSLK